MEIKQFIKYVLGAVQCRIYHISVPKKAQVYIGRGVRIIGGDKISLGNRVVIRPDVDLWCCGKAVEIGDGSEIGERCRISIANSLYIGKKVLMSPNVYVTDCDHKYADVGIPIMDQGIVKSDRQVTIKDHAFIGINTVIIGNVTIGKGSVIGANSVVTKSIPDYCVAVGNPARVIKQYDERKRTWVQIFQEPEKENGH